MMCLNNKVVIITGSAQGLGKAFAARLLEDGAKVCISDVNRDKGEAAAAELGERFGPGNVVFVECDVTKETEFRRLFDRAEAEFRVECVDILVNNAGINASHGWRRCMEVNILAVMCGAEIAMERMRRAGKHGQIVNTASLAGLGPGVDWRMAAYTVSKHGVVAMTRTLATAGGGVAHKALCPAWTDTEIVSGANTAADPALLRARSSHIARLGGLMTVRHVAEGFHTLVTQCDNGSVMVVMKDTPYTLLPDLGRPLILGTVAAARLLDKISSPQLVTGRQLVAVVALSFGLILVALAFAC